MTDWYDYLGYCAEQLKRDLECYWSVQRELEKGRRKYKRYKREPYPELDDLIKELEDCIKDADATECDMTNYKQEEFEERLHVLVEDLIYTYYRVAAERKYFEWDLFYGRNNDQE